MKINIQSYNDVQVVEMQGELIVEYLQQFKDAIAKIISDKPTGIVLDMTNIGFIDSQALEYLLLLRDDCHEANSQLKLAGLDENCEKILEITRLQLQLDTYEELAEAVKSFV